MGREKCIFTSVISKLLPSKAWLSLSIQNLSPIPKPPNAINRFLSSSGNSFLFVRIHWRLFLCNVCFIAREKILLMHLLPSSCPCTSNSDTSFETSGCHLVWERFSCQAQEVSVAFQIAFPLSPSFWTHYPDLVLRKMLLLLLFVKLL